MPPSPEHQQFEHQPEIANLIEISPLPELVDMPDHNVILPPNPATAHLPEEQRLRPIAEAEEDAAVEGLLKGLVKYRDHERRLASNWKRYIEFGQGPYASAGGQPIHDPSLTTKDQQRPATPEDIYKLQKATLDAERQAIVSQLSERVKTGDGKRILERLQATANHIANGASAARAKSDTEEVALQSQTNRHNEAVSRNRSATGEPTTVEDAAKEINGEEELGKPRVRFFNRRSTRRRKQHEISEADKKIAEKDAALRNGETLSSYAPKVTVIVDEKKKQVSDPSIIGGTAQEGYDLHERQIDNAAARNANSWSNGDTHTRDDGTVVVYMKPYGDMMGDIVKEARKERDRHFNSANAEITRASEELGNHWPIDYGENSSIESQIKGLLSFGNNQANKLSRRDGGRGELIDQANKVNFRLLQRKITAHALNGDPQANYELFYTDDGGIYYNTSDGPRVVYEDGSRSAIEDGVFVRRQGDGQKWKAPAEAVALSDADTAAIETLRTTPGVTAGDWLNASSNAFSQWEASRNPVDKLRATAYEKIAHESMEETSATLRSTHIDHRADRIEAIQEELLAASTAGDPEAEQALRDEEAQLSAELRPYLDQYQRQRAEINKGMYWLGLLEAKPIPGPETPQRRFGWTALQGTMKSPAPYIQADGVVHWNRATLHGIEGDWQINPNGEAVLNVRFKDTTGADCIRHTRYSPDGSSESIEITVI